jgi:hypothetical protein
MSVGNHKRVIRYGADELRCSDCGRIWRNDEEPPSECTQDTAKVDRTYQRERRFSNKARKVHGRFRA